MNTLTKTVVGTVLTLLVVAVTTMSTFAADLTFNKIRISGNVKLEIIQGDKESVSVIGEYSARNTSIKRKGYVLLINSSEYEPVTIRVCVKDLQRIDASDKVEVETIGTFKVKYLQVFLKDDAKANVKASSESMYTFIKDRSDLKISGKTLSHTIVRDSVSKLTMQHFVATVTTTNDINETLALSLNAK